MSEEFSEFYSVIKQQLSFFQSRLTVGFIYEEENSQFKIGIWKVDEDESSIRQKITFEDWEEEYIALLKGGRKLEWMAGRYVLHLISGDVTRHPCSVDRFGKPYVERDGVHISLSHSDKLIAAMMGSHPLGIDIQKRVEKIKRIETKFISSAEFGSLDDENRVDHLHIYWGAKESIYKAYGRKKLDFKKNIFITPFRFKNEGSGEGQILKEGNNLFYDINWKSIENFTLVYATQKI